MSCDCPNPRTEYDNLGVFLRFDRYGLAGDEVNRGNEYYRDHNDFDGWDEMEAHIWKHFDPAVVLRVYMLSHSGRMFNTTGFDCPWDSGQVGFIFAPKDVVRKEYSVKRITKKTIGHVNNVLIAEISQYDIWQRGECCSEDDEE